MNLTDIIYQTIDRWPDRVAVVHKNRSSTYAELRVLAIGFKKRLADAGFGRGDRAVLWMENSAEYIAAYLAVLELEGAVVALHPQVPASEVSRIVSHVGATGLMVASSVRQWTPADFESTCLRFVLRDHELIPCNRPTETEKNPAGLAQIIYTSGSTGRPKGVMLSHQNFIANTESILAYLRLGPEDSTVAVLPFVYAYGNSVMLTHLFVGGKIIIENSFAYPNIILERIFKERVTGFSGVASTYALLLNQSNLKAYTFPALRYLTTAGGPMPSELLGRLRSAFSEQEIYLMYGQTEAAARLTYLPPENLGQKEGSAGKPIPGVALKIVQEGGTVAEPYQAGEVYAFGENIMQGYWKDPEATAKALEGGWLRTGDIGYLDEDGYLTIVGRNSEMIKSGAFRISPVEIEEILLGHPAVQEAGVVGVEDPILGEVICGVVVPKKEHQPTDLELLAHCARHLAPYKRPKAICLVPELPKSFSGKVLRQELRAISRTVFKSPARVAH